MSLLSLISDIKTKVFGLKKQKTTEKNTPIFDNEYIPDLEAGEGGFYKRLKERQASLELYSKPLNWDIEKADRSIICGEVVIDINGFEKCEIIENYVSFMDVVNYFSTPINERENYNLPYLIDDMVKQENLNRPSHISIDINDDYIFYRSKFTFSY